MAHLLVTNDFPPKLGGIQSYLENLVDGLVAGGDVDLTVYAPTWKGCEEHDRRAAASGPSRRGGPAAGARTCGWCPGRRGSGPR